MSKRKTRKAAWLLSVASAYSVLAACSDDPSASGPDAKPNAKPDANVESRDSGGSESQPPKADAAATEEPLPEEMDPADGTDFTTLIGVILFPPGNDDVPELDGGTFDTPPADDASTDAEIEFVGLVALPPYATANKA